MSIKSVESLQVSDLQAHAVWQYTNSDEGGETAVRPIKRFPVKSLTGRVVGTEVRLANGSLAWGLIGNVDAEDPRLSEYFLTLSVERNGRWFTLARYHDSDYVDRGPESLARFLELDINDVFPISYDITHCAKGNVAALAGKIPLQPREKLTRAEIIGLAVP